MYGHPRGSVMNAFIYLMDDHLVPSLGILRIHVLH
jgi:hypothetical protein